MEEAQTVVVPADALRELGARIFAGVGAPPDVAAVVAGALVEANLTGHDSHGALRIPQYVEEVRAGIVRPAARPTVLRDRGATLLVSGEWGFGQAAGHFAMDRAVERAKAHGVAAVGLVRCHHLGRVGAYPEQRRHSGARMMAAADELREWVATYGGEVAFRRLDGPTATVAEAATSLGVPEEQVMKSLLYVADGRPHLVIANGRHRVDERKLAACLGVARKQLRMATGEEALQHAGSPLGVLPPFGHRAPLPTLLDARAAAEPILWGGTGEDRVLLGIAPAELRRLSGARVADLVRDP